MLDQAKRPVVTLGLKGTSTGTTTTFSLRKGTTYRLVASGTYGFGPGTRVADAACSWHRSDDAQWSRTAENTTSATRLKVLVGGVSRWWSLTGGDCDRESHTYVWDYTPTKTGPVTVKLDDTVRTDNTGSLSVRVLRAGANPWPYRAALPAMPAEPQAAAVDTAGDPLEDETVEPVADGGHHDDRRPAGRPQPTGSPCRAPSPPVTAC
ncbi:hypothetical protein GCM10025868_13180 [Angustibacter aerolatus]|uniref:Uncharacterized protein n=1 Tax=Angustibacter aerolatus TaxID=1162965 RepID=A0ABQ6JD24_9ACTN|nr:hypothetical protein [Angustibacter aerolatus]GMA86068.1 hypothetical protein GCM10025868_13180 [Angustibacter aerolatus]